MKPRAISLKDLLGIAGKTRRKASLLKGISSARVPFHLYSRSSGATSKNKGSDVRMHGAHKSPGAEKGDAGRCQVLCISCCIFAVLCNAYYVFVLNYTVCFVLLQCTTRLFFRYFMILPYVTSILDVRLEGLW